MENNDFIIENGVLKRYKGLDINLNNSSETNDKSEMFFLRFPIESRFTVPPSFYEELESLINPKGEITIGEEKIPDRKKLISVTIPDVVNKIAPFAFANCDNLIGITIPNSVTEIGMFAFSNCKKLNSIIIPKSVKRIDNSIFFGCTSLNKIEVEKGNKVYHSEGNCIIETKTKKLIVGCSSSIIPDDGRITEIEHGAFSYCDNLSSITIPEGVTKIDYCAFRDCKLLSNIMYKGTMKEWQSIKLGEAWANGVSTKVVHCSDGDVPIIFDVIVDPRNVIF